MRKETERKGRKRKKLLRNKVVIRGLKFGRRAEQEIENEAEQEIEKFRGKGPVKEGRGGMITAGGAVDKIESWERCVSSCGASHQEMQHTHIRTHRKGKTNTAAGEPTKESRKQTLLMGRFGWCLTRSFTHTQTPQTQNSPYVHAKTHPPAEYFITQNACVCMCIHTCIYIYM